MDVSSRFLNTARRSWLATFFRNAGLILLAGAISDSFVKLPRAGRVALVVGLILAFAVGLLSATKTSGQDEGGD